MATGDIPNNNNFAVEISLPVDIIGKEQHQNRWHDMHCKKSEELFDAKH
jgi:hypothetical protein